MLNILFGFIAGAAVAFVLLAAYHPGFVRDTRRLCVFCHEQIKRGHRFYLIKGKPRHYYCKEPTLDPALANIKSTVEALQEAEMSLSDESVMNAVEPRSQSC